MSAEDHDRFVYIAGRYGQQIKFYNVEKLLPEKVSEIKKIFARSMKRFSVATTFKLFLCDVLPKEIEKIIFLDADTIVNLDINELWQVDLGDKVFGAVSEQENGMDGKGFPICQDGFTEPEFYFNVGAMLINLNRYRLETENIVKSMEFVANNARYGLIDQDALNHCFGTNYLKLPIKFNYFGCWLGLVPGETVGKKIYHYSGSNLRLDIRVPFYRLWFKYFCKTPWFNEEIFGRLYESVIKVHDEGKNLALQATKIMSGKERGFFVNGANVEAVRNIFAVSADEEIISDSVEDLIQSMKKSQGKKVFFILLMNFQDVANILNQAGFVYGRDFVNGLDFLSTAQGMFYNTHQIVLDL